MTIPSGLDWDSLVRRQGDCAHDFSGISRTDCHKPAGHNIRSDGFCGTKDDLQPKNDCKFYCEIRRAGFLGNRQYAPGKFGQLQLQGDAIGLSSGDEETITMGFEIGLEGTIEDAIGGGASFQYRDPEKHPAYRSRWVFWPKMVMTCGDLARNTHHKESVPRRVGFDIDVCEGDRVTDHNVCTTTPFLDDEGNVDSFWALLYIDPKTNEEAPLENQTIMYQDAVSNSIGAPKRKTK
ncbi:hypothetical protein JX265_003253 [Neoarthrinium moseri]|uniref:Uncharacterized protein n=1 Tax=Neoarthrinium moseri TaxID=1658444 RepID=A0A9P9WUA9_9PEZI|nr:hypothetical protein JX265_003253 [Neoarthrinium moseri]